MAQEPLRFSAAVSQITLDDDVELLANVFLQQARRIPHLLRHVAEGRCTLGPLAN